HELLELRTQVAKEGSEVAKRAFVRLRKESEWLSFVHKTHLQCLLGRGCLIDSACDDSLIQAALLTLMPTNLLKLKEVTILTVAALASLVNWVRCFLSVSTTQNISFHFLITFVAVLETQIGTLEEVLCCDKDEITNVVFKGVLHQL
ncbi:hypothetical protein Tco_1390712, partial [Tanacetum coccineum]